MKFSSSMRRKRTSPSRACARFSMSARAATSPGALVQPARASGRIWSSWPTSARPLPSRNDTYGSPRMTRELQDEGLTMGRRRTARLMRENGLKARQKRRFKRTTDSHHAFPIAPNLLEQDFSAERPNQKWAADISYLWTNEGWLYLAVVLDLFARRVVGWAVSDRLHKELALEALRKALAIRRPGEGLTHHADRGSQYCSIEYQAELRKHGIRISMSGKGNCYDCENVRAARGA